MSDNTEPLVSSAARQPDAVIVLKIEEDADGGFVIPPGALQAAGRIRIKGGVLTVSRAT